MVKVREWIARDLRERGWSDDEIAKMAPEEAFDEYCMWHGLIGWGPTLRYVLEELGLVRTEAGRE